MKINLKYRLKTRIKNNIKLNQKVFDFNKEILIGEIGALIGAPMFGFLGSLLSRNANFVSFATLFGSIMGAGISWLATRLYDQKKYNDFSTKKFVKEVSLYTPVAFLISLLVGYPIVVLVTHSLFVKEHVSYLSSFIGELSGFVVFLILINTYRYILSNKLNKEL